MAVDSADGVVVAALAECSGVGAQVFVYCHECGAQGPTLDAYDDESDLNELKLAAAMAWNERTSKNRALYDANAESGLNIWPRASE
ncbi:hypothetical protein WG219_11235 [Ectopseudomonas mendocina]|uniref:Uncharacterized protein n=1 Tax=Ectopseudomonas mendocina TaxID=300 RepID=A0ABZ2RIM6_ECTME